MSTKRITMRVLAGLTLFAGFGLTAARALPPAPKAEDLAGVQPKQAGVAVTTPAGAELARCRVEPFPSAAAPVGYVLLDGTNRPVRRVIAAGTPGFNIVSYYLDGLETYRETATAAGAGKFDQFRWLGSNGGKIGRDLDGNGTIDVWDAISPEEVSRELFDALAANNPAKLRALLPTEAELKTLGLPPAEIAKIGARVAKAEEKLKATAATLALTPKAKWVHVELFMPETTASDAFGGVADLVRHRNASVLFDRGDAKTADFFQTGELIQIGRGWRLIDGPAAGAAGPAGANDGDGAEVPAEAKDLVQKLLELKEAPASTPAATAKFHMDRAAILEQIVAKLNGKPQQEQWTKQLLDAYTAAADNGEAKAGERLGAWRTQIEKFAPNTPLAGFVAFRHTSVEYTARLKEATTPGKSAETQKWWREQLEAFVKAYPTLDETAEALLRLGMATEYNGKDGEAAAKGHYETLAKNFPQHPSAPQAAGAVRRLSLEGQPMPLAGTDLATGKPFDGASLSGKVTIVFFWGSFSGAQLKQQASDLTDLLKKYAGRVEVVTVSLDATPQAAVQAINAAQLPGTHLFSTGGALATNYGVMGQHFFLIGKDGKVANKNAQFPLAVDEVEALLKK